MKNEKYKIALENIIKHLSVDECNEDINVLIGLVDKELPKIPKKMITSSFGIYCPNCNESIYYYSRPNRCVKCGQVFDWENYSR